MKRLHGAGAALAAAAPKPPPLDVDEAHSAAQLPAHSGADRDWVRSSDVSLADLWGHGPPGSGGSRPDETARRSAAPSTSAATSAAYTSAALEYKAYLTKHVLCMNPLVYALIINRHGIAARVHSHEARWFSLGSLPFCSRAALQDRSWLALAAAASSRAICALYNAWMALLLTAFVLLTTWWSRRKGRRTLSDSVLAHAVFWDACVASLNALTMLEYVARPHVECDTPALAASVGACLLRGYWPATYLAFTTKWVGSALPNEVVFMPELFRAACFFGCALASSWAGDGKSAALAPLFLLGLLARAVAGFACTLLCVALAAGRFRVDAAATLPPQLLDWMCPRFLRRARAAACAAAATCAAMLQAAAGHGFQNSQTGVGPAGGAAFSAAVTIMMGESHCTLRNIGRVQVGLFVAGLLLGALGNPPPEATPAGSFAQPQLAWSDVVLENELGVGSYSVVVRAKWRGTPVAVKQWRGEADSEQILAEAELIMALRHPNILTVFGLLPAPRALVMELGQCTLLAVLQSQTLSWPRRVELASGIAAGMDYLHAQGLVHGDLSCTNVILVGGGVPKVADFGLSYFSHEAQRRRGHGTLTYAAPELLRAGVVPLPQAADAYAFGVVLEHLAEPARALAAQPHSFGSGGSSSRSSAQAAAFMRALFARLLRDGEQLRPALSSSCPARLAQLVAACCAACPEARPAFAEVRARLLEATAEAEQWPAPAQSPS